jgi:hypothetical protein
VCVRVVVVMDIEFLGWHISNHVGNKIVGFRFILEILKEANHEFCFDEDIHALHLL